MDKISQQINNANNKIHSYDQMRKIIFHLGSFMITSRRQKGMVKSYLGRDQKFNQQPEFLFRSD